MKPTNILTYSLVFLALIILQLPLNAQVTEKLDSMITEKYDTANSSFQLRSKWTMSYDSANNNSQWEAERWDPVGLNWDKREKATYTYDSIGNRLQEIYSEWDTDSSRYFMTNRADYTYQNSNVLNGIYSFNYNQMTQAWDSSYQLVFTFDTALNITSETSFYWDNNSSQWIGDERSTFTYISSNQIDQEFEYRWDSNTSDWDTIANTREDYIYNTTTGFLDTVYNFNWMSIPGMYQTTYRSIYTRDSLGNLLNNAGQNFISPNGWTTTEESIYTFNYNSLLEDIALPIDYITDLDDDHINKVNDWTSYQYNYSADSLYLEDVRTYYYSPLGGTLSIEDIKSTNSFDFTVYPNPAKDLIKINLDGSKSTDVTLRIINASGQTVKTVAIDPNNSISISDLSFGLFFLELNRDNERAIKKLLVK